MDLKGEEQGSDEKTQGPTGEFEEKKRDSLTECVGGL